MARGSAKGVSLISTPRRWSFHLLLFLLAVGCHLLQSVLFLQAPYFNEDSVNNVNGTAWVTFALAFAGFGPLLYALLDMAREMRPKTIAIGTLIILVYLAVMNALFWTFQDTSYVLVALFILTLSTSLVGNASILVFLRYVEQLGTIFNHGRTFLLMGYSASGWVALLLCVLVASQPTFSYSFTTAWFYGLTAMVITTASMAFAVVEFLLPGVEMIDEQGVRHRLNSQESYSAPGITEMVSPNDLLVPSGMDDLFSIPLSSLRSSVLEFASPRIVLQSVEQQRYIILKHFFILCWTECLLHFLPGAFQPQTNSDDQIFVLNCIFLLAPSLGLSLSYLGKRYQFAILLIVQLLLFVWLELAAFSFTSAYAYAPFWLVCLQVGWFCMLSTYIRCMAIYSILRSIRPGGRWRGQDVAIWTSLLSPVGGLLGSGLSLACVYANFFN